MSRDVIWIAGIEFHATPSGWHSERLEGLDIEGPLVAKVCEAHFPSFPVCDIHGRCTGHLIEHSPESFREHRAFPVCRGEDRKLCVVDGGDGVVTGWSISTGDRLSLLVRVAEGRSDQIILTNQDNSAYCFRLVPKDADDLPDADDEDELKTRCVAAWVWLDGDTVKPDEAAAFQWFWSDVDDDAIPAELRCSRQEVESEWADTRRGRRDELLGRMRQKIEQLAVAVGVPDGLWAVVGHDPRGDGITRSPNVLLGIGTSEGDARELAGLCQAESAALVSGTHLEPPEAEVREYDPADYFSECEWAQVKCGRELTWEEQEYAAEQGWDGDDIRRWMAHQTLMERLMGD